MSFIKLFFLLSSAWYQRVSTLLRTVAISLFVVLDFFENLMKAMGHIPGETHACVLTGSRTRTHTEH